MITNAYTHIHREEELIPEGSCCEHPLHQS